MARASTSKRRPSPEFEASSDLEDQLPGETQFSSHESDDPENFFDVESILDEDEAGGKYLIKWKGKDPSTGRPWKNSWEPKSNCTPSLIAEWKKKKRRREAMEDLKMGDNYDPRVKPSTSRSSLRSSAASKPASTRSGRSSDHSRPPRSSLHAKAVEIPVQRVSGTRIPSKRHAAIEKADDSDDDLPRRATKRRRQSVSASDRDAQDDGEESEELGVQTRSRKTVSTSNKKQNGNGKRKATARGSSGTQVEEPIELSSGSEHEVEMLNDDDDEDDDLKPRFGGKANTKPRLLTTSNLTAPAVKVGPPKGKKKKSHTASLEIDVEMTLSNDELPEEEPGTDEAETESAGRRRASAKKRERPSVLSEGSGRDTKKRKVDDAERSVTPSISPSKVTAAIATKDADFVPDSQPQSVAYSTTQSTPSKSQISAANTSRPMRTIASMRDQMTPSKFIRKKGILDSSDAEVEEPQVSTQIESFSSPSQQKKAPPPPPPKPLNMRSVEGESVKATTSTAAPAAADDGWGATGWTGDTDHEALPLDESARPEDLPGQTVDDVLDNLPAVGSGQVVEQESELTTEVEVNEAGVASVAVAGTAIEMPAVQEMEIVEVEAVDGVVTTVTEENVHTEVISEEPMDAEDDTERAVVTKVVDVVEVDVLVPGTAPTVEDDHSDLVLPAFDDNAPEVQAALELVRNREEELEIIRAEKLAATARRDTLQRKLDELAKERDMYKDRCEFLTKELFESDPVPHHTDSNQHSGGGAERVVSAYAASGAPASQEELEALFSGSNTNSTQEELVTLRSQLDVVAAERDELKVSLALVQGTEANLRAELETKTVAVERLSEDVSRHAKRAQEYESDADLLRQVYAAASSSAAERKQEADELRQQNAILRGQVKDGVAGAKLFAQARVGALQADVKKWRAMAELQLKRADRSELVEIREKAAKEPVLQKRIRALKVQVQELEQENEELDRQVKTARAERLIERPMEEERRRREAMQMGADDGLADFEPDDMVYRCEWWETLNERCRAVYRTKGELWDHILSSDHIGMNS